jgi:GTP-binding protein
VKVLSAEFVASATDTAGIPRGATPQIALVGRSNVGKSSLINALTRSKVARTSAAAGKTTFLNLYEIHLAGVAAQQDDGARGPTRRTLYLVDLPGYGYARGGQRSARAFDALTRAYFSGQREHAGRTQRLVTAAILALDARHPGLERDLDAYAWLEELQLPLTVVATKVDRMRRAERDRATLAFQTVMQCPVLLISSVSGEGLRTLWRAIGAMAWAPGQGEGDEEGEEGEGG